MNRINVLSLSLALLVSASAYAMESAVASAVDAAAQAAPAVPAGTPVVASQGILQKGVESMRAAGSAIRNGATNSWRGITASADWTKKAVSNGYTNTLTFTQGQFTNHPTRTYTILGVAATVAIVAGSAWLFNYFTSKPSKEGRRHTRLA